MHIDDYYQCDIFFSLNSYSYQPSEYVGTGDVSYSEGMSFGPTGPPLEAATTNQDGRTTPTESDHQSAEREYKFSTEGERHSPSEESALPPRSPTQ